MKKELLIFALLLWPLPLFALFGSDDLKTCKNDNVALELKNKYCYKDKIAAETELEQLKKQYGNEKAAFKSRIHDLEAELDALRAQLALTQKNAKDQEQALSQRIKELEQTLKTLKDSATGKEKELLAANEELQKRLGGELRRLKKELQKEREERLAEIADLKAKNEKEATQLKENIRNLEAELARLQKLSKDQKNELERMQNQGKELEKQLEQEIKNGEIRLKKFSNRLIINLDDKISFDSGSDKLKPGVKKALRKIKKILSDYAENRIIVEGHTDNIPYRGRRFKDNWELSAKRALSVLRFLLKQSDMDERRFSAAGYGAYQPLVSNDTPENRSQNRRVDIVVIPRINN